MIGQLKQKYASNGTTRQEKLQLLTVLPRSCTSQKMMDTFNTTRYLATQAKQLLDEGAFHTAQRSPLEGDDREFPGKISREFRNFIIFRFPGNHSEFPGN